jgi:hypothetical protein
VDDAHDKGADGAEDGFDLAGLVVGGGWRGTYAGDDGTHFAERGGVLCLCAGSRLAMRLWDSGRTANF